METDWPQDGVVQINVKAAVPGEANARILAFVLFLSSEETTEKLHFFLVSRAKFVSHYLINASLCFGKYTFKM